MTRFRTFLEMPSRSNAFACARFTRARARAMLIETNQLGFHIMPSRLAFVVPNEIYARVQIEQDNARRDATRRE